MTEYYVTLIDDNDTQNVEIDPKLLSTASEYFEAMFNGKFSASKEIKCEDIALGEQLLKFLQRQITEFDFENIDLFDLLDLADYWLCISSIYDACKKELDANWENYDIDRTITYMTKYDIEEPQIDFEQFKYTPFELLALLNKHNIDTRANNLFDQCMEQLTTHWHKYEIEQVFLTMIKYNYYFFTVSEHNFTGQNPIMILEHAETLEDKALSKAVNKQFKSFIQYDSTNNIVHDLNLLHYFNQSDELTKELKKMTNYFSSTKHDRLLNSPNLIDLNLGVLTYREPNANGDYDGTRDYPNSEREKDDWNSYYEFWHEIFNRLLEIAENKSERALYLIEQIEDYSYYNEISYNFAVKLCSYVSKEVASKFAKNVFTYKDADAFGLAQYL